MKLLLSPADFGLNDPLLHFLFRFGWKACGEEHFDDFTDITFLHFCCTLLYIQLGGEKLNKKMNIFGEKISKEENKVTIMITENMK